MNRGTKIVVSVVVSAFNRKDLVLRAIQSAQQSTYSSTELIYVDQGSEDGTIEALKDIPGLRVVSCESRSATMSRNAGASVAKGDIILFLDSDAELFPDTIERAVEMFIDAQVGIVGPVILSSEDRKTVLTRGVVFVPLLFVPIEVRLTTINHDPTMEFHSNTTVFAITEACMFMRKSLFDNLGGFDTDLLPYGEEGFDICWRCWKYGHSVRVVDTVAFHRPTSVNPRLQSTNVVKERLTYYLANTVLVYVKDSDATAILNMPIAFIKSSIVNYRYTGVLGPLKSLALFCSNLEVFTRKRSQAISSPQRSSRMIRHLVMNEK